MAYAAFGLAILGLSAGLMSRLKVLLLLVGAVFLLSIGFAVRGGFSFLGGVAILTVAQAILQTCYLLGVVIHTLLSSSHVEQSETEAEAMDPGGKATVSVFSGPHKTRRLLRLLAQGTARSEVPSRQR
jgi:hypothetical protein